VTTDFRHSDESSATDIRHGLQAGRIFNQGSTMSGTGA